jgi:hypothetical protein
LKNEKSVKKNRKGKRNGRNTTLPSRERGDD